MIGTAIRIFGWVEMRLILIVVTRIIVSSIVTGWVVMCPTAIHAVAQLSV